MNIDFNNAVKKINNHEMDIFDDWLLIQLKTIIDIFEKIDNLVFIEITYLIGKNTINIVPRLGLSNNLKLFYQVFLTSSLIKQQRNSQIVNYKNEIKPVYDFFYTQGINSFESQKINHNCLKINNSYQLHQYFSSKLKTLNYDSIDLNLNKKIDLFESKLDLYTIISRANLEEDLINFLKKIKSFQLLSAIEKQMVANSLIIPNNNHNYKI